MRHIFTSYLSSSRVWLSHSARCAAYSQSLAFRNSTCTQDGSSSVRCFLEYTLKQASKSPTLLQQLPLYTHSHKGFLLQQTHAF